MITTTTLAYAALALAFAVLALTWPRANDEYSLSIVTGRHSHAEVARIWVIVGLVTGAVAGGAVVIAWGW